MQASRRVCTGCRFSEKAHRKGPSPNVHNHARRAGDMRSVPSRATQTRQPSGAMRSENWRMNGSPSGSEAFFSSKRRLAAERPLPVDPDARRPRPLPRGSIPSPHVGDASRPTRRRPYPSDLRDDQWRAIETLLPPDAATGRRRRVDLREVVCAINYRWTTGCTWRMLPHDFPPWGTVYSYFRRWQRAAILPQIRQVVLTRRRTSA